MAVSKVDAANQIENELPNANLATIATTKLGAGAILQVLQASKTDTQTITSTSMVDVTGLSINITPRDTNSKILVSYNIYAVGDNYISYINLLRDSTILGLADGSGDSRSRVTSQDASLNTTTNQHGFFHLHSRQILDSPASSSQLTYKIQSKARSSSTHYINRTVPDRQSTEYDFRGTSFLQVMEIAG